MILRDIPGSHVNSQEKNGIFRHQGCWLKLDIFALVFSLAVCFTPGDIFFGRKGKLLGALLRRWSNRRQWGLAGDEDKLFCCLTMLFI